MHSDIAPIRRRVKSLDGSRCFCTRVGADARWRRSGGEGSHERES
jgi:hypothetical protein